MASTNFVDYVKIFCRSGAGGPGSMHLHRDKRSAKGGPDGGNGPGTRRTRDIKGKPELLDLDSLEIPAPRVCRRRGEREWEFMHGS